jgi:hypothetical protein
MKRLARHLPVCWRLFVVGLFVLLSVFVSRPRERTPGTWIEADWGSRCKCRSGLGAPVEKARLQLWPGGPTFTVMQQRELALSSLAGPGSGNDSEADSVSEREAN